MIDSKVTNKYIVLHANIMNLNKWPNYSEKR